MIILFSNYVDRLALGIPREPNLIYVKAGDKVRLAIEKLGVQEQLVLAWNRHLD